MESITTKSTPSLQKQNKSHLTAITRKGLSAPMKHLVDQDCIAGKVLDYGCGKGTDADIIGADKFDPYWYARPLVDTYDTITCIYVLNVIRDLGERQEVLSKIQRLLNPNGKAYIAVRRDRFIEGETARGTWQGHIYLNAESVVYSKGKFEIYKITKESKDVI
jgi:hypothetical protein